MVGGWQVHLRPLVSGFQNPICRVASTGSDKSVRSQAGKQLLCCVNSDRKLPGCGDTHPLSLPSDTPVSVCFQLIDFLTPSLRLKAVCVEPEEGVGRLCY